MISPTSSPDQSPNASGLMFPKPSGKNNQGATSRFVKDLAAFDKRALRDIWEYPPCLLTGGKADDWHHNFGRGQEFGIPKRNPLRKVFSSVLNAVPVNRKDHDRRNLKDPDIRLQLFEKVYAMVSLAVVEGRYSFTDDDMTFLAFVNRYQENPHGHKLLTPFASETASDTAHRN